MSRTRIAFAALLLAGAAACSRPVEQKVEPKKDEAAAPQQPAPPQATVPQPAESPRMAEAPAPKAAPARRAPAKRPQTTPTASTSRPPAPVFDTEGPAPKPEPAERVIAERPAPPPAPVAPPEPPKPRTAVVAAGTPLSVRLTESLDSGKNRAGDTFEAILDHDIEVDGVVVAPAGSAVAGKVVTSLESGRVEGRASMSLTLTSLRVRNDPHPINSNTVSFEAESSKKGDAVKIGGAAGLGAVIGAIAGGGKGAAIGAAVGAAAGTGTVLATRGKQVELASEQRLSFKLDSPVTLPIPR